MYVCSGASVLKVTGSTATAGTSQCSKYKIPKLVTFYLMNVLQFCLQEHRYGGESFERNDTDCLGEKSHLGVHGSVKDTVDFAQSAFTNVDEVSEHDL